jgi:hypothetical protein
MLFECVSHNDRLDHSGREIKAPIREFQDRLPRNEMARMSLSGALRLVSTNDLAPAQSGADTFGTRHASENHR